MASPRTSNLKLRVGPTAPPYGVSIGQAGRDASTTRALEPWQKAYVAASVVGVPLGAYHGYKRNDSIGWGIWWGLMGGLFPVFTIPFAFAQGLGKPEKP